MTILDLLLFVIGLAGVGFMIYVFSVIQLFGSKARWFGISLLVLIGLLFSDRIMTPRAAWNFAEVVPIRPRGDAEDLFQTGWREIPYVMFNLLLTEFGNFADAAPPPASPAPSVAPSLSPSPVPRTPSPSPTPSPTPFPSPSPATPTPIVPNLPPRAAPRPAPAPAPAPPIAPKRPSPIPAWW